MTVGLSHYLIVAGILFSLGVFCVLSRKNAVSILMGIELILNSCNLNLVAFSHFIQPENFWRAQAFVIFVIVLAATEAAVFLAMLVAVYQDIRSIDVDAIDTLKG